MSVLKKGKENNGDYLQPTAFCDYKHSSIQTFISKALTLGLSERDLAVYYFNYVRDNIAYKVGEWNHKASDTLHDREGTCSNKACLLVALLRGSGIPACYGVMVVNAQGYFGNPGMFLKYINKKYFGIESVHTYVMCKLSHMEKWVSVDCSDDALMVSSFPRSTVNDYSLVQWDGNGDAHMDWEKTRQYIYKDMPMVANIDHLMIKKMRDELQAPVKVFNFMIQYMREGNYTNIDKKQFEIENAKFRMRIKKECPQLTQFIEENENELLAKEMKRDNNKASFVVSTDARLVSKL